MECYHRWEITEAELIHEIKLHDGWEPLQALLIQYDMEMYVVDAFVLSSQTGKVPYYYPQDKFVSLVVQPPQPSIIDTVILSTRLRDIEMRLHSRVAAVFEKTIQDVRVKLSKRIPSKPVSKPRREWWNR